MSIKRLTKRDMALVILRIDKRCGRGYFETMERIRRIAGVHPRTADHLYDHAYGKLKVEEYEKAIA